MGSIFWPPGADDFSAPVVASRPARAVAPATELELALLGTSLAAPGVDLAAFASRLARLDIELVLPDTDLAAPDAKLTAPDAGLARLGIELVLPDAGLAAPSIDLAMPDVRRDSLDADRRRVDAWLAVFDVDRGPLTVDQWLSGPHRVDLPASRRRSPRPSAFFAVTDRPATGT